VEGDDSSSARATDADAADVRVVRAAVADGVISCHPVPDWVRNRAQDRYRERGRRRGAARGQTRHAAGHRRSAAARQSVAAVVVAGLAVLAVGEPVVHAEAPGVS
jgi:hypothetical protein